jgi:excisionase family DNA binding protein
MGEDWDTARDRVTIQEAARRLGVKEDAIRKRIQRGTLPHEKTEAGRVFVWVDTAQDATQDTTEDTTQDTSRDALLEAKDETIAALREQLQSERQAHAEARRIIAGLVERIPPQLEAPSEPPGASETATPQPGRVEPQAAVESTQEPRESSEMHMPEVGGGPLPRDQQAPSERRPWWRRMFGG